jgi:hypothetical protein
MCAEGEEFAQRNGLVFLETSAKTAHNVEEAFGEALMHVCMLCYVCICAFCETYAMCVYVIFVRPSCMYVMYMYVL